MFEIVLIVYNFYLSKHMQTPVVICSEEACIGESSVTLTIGLTEYSFIIAQYENSTTGLLL